MDVSIVTVTYNSAEALQRYASAGIPSGVEWIVVDNASSDASVAVAERLGARVIALSQNKGFSAANNVGLQQASGTHVGFINPDVSVLYEDLPTITTLLDCSPVECLAAPQLLDPDGAVQPNGRGVPTLLRKVRNRSGSGGDGDYRVVCSEGETKYVCWAMGAAVFGKRSTWQRLGGWDERFFVYYEDHDLGLRAWSSGMAFVLSGDVRWVHGWARETSKFRLRPWILELDGMWKFFTRYPGLLVSPRLVAGGGEIRRLVGQNWAGCR